MESLHNESESCRMVSEKRSIKLAAELQRYGACAPCVSVLGAF